MQFYKHFILVLGLTACAGPVYAQSNGTLTGTVVLEAKGSALHHASILVTPLNRRAETDDFGVYEVKGLPPGTYTVTAHMHALSDDSQTVRIEAGGTATANFKLRLAALKNDITVTASGKEESALESFQSVVSLDTLDLAQKAETSLGEVLNNQPGIAKRSFGPGASRPVIRGFDGDRVLVMQDGVSTGALSSQSGDHGESIDVMNLERLEVVKGPATLLYGSNAIGGVVNAVTGHHQAEAHPHEGARGYVTAVGGTNNGHGGGSAGVEVGVKDWLLWANGSSQRTGDYRARTGVVENSKTRIASSTGGFGYFGNKRYFSLGYGYEEGRYGVPYSGQFGGSDGPAPLIDLEMRRHNLRFTAGEQHTGRWVDAFRMTLNYSDYQHQELEDGEAGTTFKNKQFSYRGVFEQRKTGRLTGSFGFSMLHRDYAAKGEEVLAPPVLQNGGAAFALEEVAFERFKLQFGGRVETNHYDPTGLASKSFTGASGAAGIQVPLWRGGSFVTNFNHSFRAPALEELYNRGPHVGNLTFEIGNVNLKSERSDGVEMSLRHQASRVRVQATVFRYDIGRFVYLAPTGEIEDGLREAGYGQADARFAGAESQVALGLNPNLWLNLGMDYVDAQFKRSNAALPRIPPLRGRLGFDARYKGLSVKPEVMLTAAQHQFFETETRTAGYTMVNLGASYTLARQHEIHVFSVNLFNAGDRLYRNHLSFIKDLAPEIGRGMRFTYTLRFF